MESFSIIHSQRQKKKKKTIELPIPKAQVYNGNNKSS